MELKQVWREEDARVRALLLIEPLWNWNAARGEHTQGSRRF